MYDDPTDELDAEVAHADRLADVLRFVTKWAGDRDLMHVIAVQGTQITVGQIVAGQLALHDARRARVPA